MPFTSNLSNCAGVCPFHSQWNADCGKNDQHSTPASAKSCTHVEGTGYSRVSIRIHTEVLVEFGRLNGIYISIQQADCFSTLGLRLPCSSCSKRG